MKNIALLFSKSAFTRITVYQYVVIFGCVVAMALALAVPIYFAEPDDWTYYYAVQNFARGQFTIDNQTHLLQLNEVRSRGGQAIQYWNIGNNRWALEKAPGFVFYMVPFKLAGIPRGGNVLLALGTVFVTFILVRRLFDEKAAMIGALLMLFTPMSLIMLNRAYMDTYASQAFLTMGGGLYLYYHLEQSRWRPMKRGILLFLSFFLAGWSVVTRYTNLPVAAILVLHFVVVKAIAWRRGDKPGIGADILPAIAGIALPVIAILLYDYFVFGSPFSYGYQYSRSEIKFAFQYLGQVNQSGQSVPLKIIWDNLKAAPRPLLVGYPLLIIGVPGIVFIVYRKLRTLFQKTKAPAIPEVGITLSWDILLILMGWFIAVFFLYLTYAWTAENPGGAFFHFSRFYLPGLLPLAIICAPVMSRFPFKLYIPALFILGAFGIMIYLQTSSHLNILPGWLVNGRNRMLPPGGRPGIFPRPPLNGNPPTLPPGRYPALRY